MFILAWLRQFLTGNKEAIGALAALFGILAGPVLSILKSLIGVLNNRSWERHSLKNAEVVAQCLRDLHEAEQSSASQGHSLEPYCAVVHERLDKALLELQRGRDRLEAKARAQFEEPAGIHKWLLLFRPHGLLGWVIHTTFYALLVASLTGWAVVAYGVVNHSAQFTAADWAAAPAAGILLTAVYGSFALLPRSLALRRRRWMILSRNRPDLESNSEWWRKALMLYKSPGRAASVERVFGYLFFVEFLFGPFMIRDDMSKSREPFHELAVGLVVMLFFGLFGLLLSYDFGLRRVLTSIGARTIPDGSTSPDASNASTSLAGS